MNTDIGKVEMPGIFTGHSLVTLTYLSTHTEFELGF